ncbi:MAG: TM2 domain-containing protein [Cyanobacteria bacterium]|nr:TM2 domain-containing protein [Cyanobacteriota bacterium]
MTVPGGRNKKTAFWLALFLGAFGVHKFYLGDAGAGYVYLALCWTFVPLLVSIYEAIHIIQMSRVSFNLAYNIEAVLKRLPQDYEPEEIGQSGVFSMVISSQGEDQLEDEWSSEDEI